MIKIDHFDHFSSIVLSKCSKISLYFSPGPFQTGRVPIEVFGKRGVAGIGEGRACRRAENVDGGHRRGNW